MELRPIFGLQSAEPWCESNRNWKMETRTPSRASLVDQARMLGPVLRERAEKTNQLRRLPDITWRDLVRSGILRGLQPIRWGGAEAHPREFYSAIGELARAEGCAGWVAGIVGVHPWQVALYPKQTQEEVWGEDPTVMNSSSYAPTGTAECVAGGYRLNGRWSFSSGCDHCKWVNLGAVVGTVELNGQQLPALRSFLLPRNDYRIDDNWHVAGLAGTGSKDIVVDGAFVPEHRSQSHCDYALGRPLPGWELNAAPLYRLPFAIVFINTVCAAILGAAAGFLDTWLEIGRTRRGGLGLVVARDPYSQKLAAEAAYTIKSATRMFLDDCDEMMDAAARGESLTMEWRAELRYNSVRSAQLAARAVDRLFEAGGGHSIFFDHPLQRRYQDIKAMMAHAAVSPAPAAKLYGMSRLGMPILDAFL
jgi:3-hydroxy-9,10-secoandrosta-1,3,5(10)-triene-9,17-dione monooxygenase